MVKKKVEIEYTVDDKASKPVKGITTSISGLAKTVGTFLAAGMFAKLGKAVIDFAKKGAKIKTVEQSFKNLTESFGQDSQKMLADLRRVAKGTVSNFDLMEKANKGLLLTNGLVAEEMPKLLEIARASAKATGEDVGFMFDSIITGIGRSSPMILDNLGLTIKIGKANEEYAKSLGKTTAELTKTEQQQALLNEVLKSGDDLIAKVGDGVGEASDNYASFGVALTNITNTMAKVTSDFVNNVAGNDTIRKWMNDFHAFWKFIEQRQAEAKRPFQAQREAIKELRQEIKNLENAYRDQGKAGANPEILQHTKDLITEKQKELSVLEVELTLLEAREKKKEQIAKDEIEKQKEKNEKLLELEKEKKENQQLMDDIFGETKEESEKRYQKLSLKRLKSSQKEELRIQKAKHDMLLNSEKTFNNLMTLSTLTKSKELFSITKAGSIATATIKGFESIAQSWGSAPFPFNLPAVAASTAAAAANVGSIVATTPQFANGGLVEPTSSGTNVTMGEAGQIELGLPSGKVGAFFDEAIDAGVGSNVPIETTIMLDKQVLVKALTSGQRKGNRNKTL